ncbi:MAG: hypothetical protein JSR17_11905 [Proteobacteria bacterium]|nr:hypothetical protein [Pseudomonadota bacterium]
MPRIDDTSLLKKKPFKKKSYRPWNLLDDSTALITKNETANLENDVINSNQKLATNRQQTDNKLATNRQQSDNIIAINKIQKKETGNKVATKPATEVTTNWQQTDNKPTTNTSFSSLIGLQRSIVIFIYQECKTTRSKISDPITLEHISTHLKCSAGTAKTTLQRLEAKRYIIRKEFKNGRGGWSRYELPEKLFHELLQNETGNKLATNRQQTDNKVATKPATEPTTSVPSSSSVINNKNTTTSKPSENDSECFLSEEWQVINIEPLADIGFSKHHLKQIANQNKISTALVQESINAFAFDLKQNGKGKTLKTSPINYLMGILRNGIPYSPPPNYESEESRAMRIYLERKRDIEQKQIELEEELLKAEFNDWQNILTNEQIDKILPEDIKNSNLAPAKTAALRTYFRNEIWPIKRQEIINMKCVE